jgi:hypothetical protein
MLGKIPENTGTENTENTGTKIPKYQNTKIPGRRDVAPIEKPTRQRLQIPSAIATGRFRLQTGPALRTSNE